MVNVSSSCLPVAPSTKSVGQYHSTDGADRRAHNEHSGEFTVSSRPPALVERIESGRIALAYLDPPYQVENQAFEYEDPREQETYLRGMAELVYQVRRTLCESGSVFFHTVPRVAGRIQTILDYIFGEDQFRSHIILPHPTSGVRARPATDHDVIILYTKSDNFVYHP